jgi:hypothetical protein
MDEQFCIGMKWLDDDSGATLFGTHSNFLHAARHCSHNHTRMPNSCSHRLKPNRAVTTASRQKGETSRDCALKAGSSVPSSSSLCAVGKHSVPSLSQPRTLSFLSLPCLDLPRCIPHSPIRRTPAQFSSKSRLLIRRSAGLDRFVDRSGGIASGSDRVSPRIHTLLSTPMRISRSCSGEF